MRAAHHVAAELRAAGLELVRGAEPGVLRLHTTTRGRLVGLLVIRADVITYAELFGRVYPFWKTRPYDEQIHELRLDIRKMTP